MSEKIRIKENYKNEREFSKQLSNYLYGKVLYVDSHSQKYTKPNSEKTIVATRHNKSKSTGRPDVKITQEEKILKMKWRKLSNPFYIECKLDPIKILYDLQQGIRYKYEKKSKKHLQLKKYGDNHIAFTCPTFLKEDFNSRKMNGGWFTEFHLIRTLWHLGLGVFCYEKRKKRYEFQFNEQEVLYIE